MAKISAIEYSAVKYNEQTALNNFQKERIVEIKHFSSMGSSKTSEHNYVNEHIVSLKYQIESLKCEILFLRQELRERNVPAKYKCIASTANDTEFHNIW